MIAALLNLLAQMAAPACSCEWDMESALSAANLTALEQA